jgi:glycosyltransferase involved in cell wall biosynthesis
MRYGTDSFRASVVRQSIDLDHYAKARAMPPEERESRRAALGLSGCVFIFVGRLWEGKGLDELWAAYRDLDLELGEKVSLLVVGDGVDEVRYRPLFGSLPRAVLPGFVQPADLPEWYALADCLVFPTHGDPNGLVVEEAFAAGLPVIVSDAAGDIHRRVPEGVAGFVVSVGSDQALRQAMAKIATGASARQAMARHVVQAVQDKSVEGYATDFTAFIDDVMQRPPRRGLAASLSIAMGYLVLTIAKLQRWRPASYVSPGD